MRFTAIDRRKSSNIRELADWNNNNDRTSISKDISEVPVISLAVSADPYRAMPAGEDVLELRDDDLVAEVHAESGESEDVPPKEQREESGDPEKRFSLPLLLFAEILLFLVRIIRSKFPLRNCCPWRSLTTMLRKGSLSKRKLSSRWRFSLFSLVLLSVLLFLLSTPTKLPTYVLVPGKLNIRKKQASYYLFHLIATQAWTVVFVLVPTTQGLSALWPVTCPLPLTREGCRHQSMLSFWTMTSFLLISWAKTLLVQSNSLQALFRLSLL